MVVPLADHGKQTMQTLEIGIRAVAGVTQAVIGQLDQFVRRLDETILDGLFGVGIAASLVLIDVIAVMHHQVQVLTRRSVCIGVEPAIGHV